MIYRWLVLFTTCFLCTLLLTSSGLAQVVDGVVAKVGSVKVTVYELKREMQRILPTNSSFHSGVSKEKVIEIQKKATQNLIERSYKVQYALVNEISVPNADIDKKLAEVRSKYKTEEELLQELQGESIKELRSAIYRMQLANVAEENVVNSQAKVTDDELKKLYEEKKHMYFRPKRYRVSHILVKVDPTLLQEERVELLVKAEDLAERAMAGEDFYNLAYYNSDEDSKFVGGDIGFFHSGQVVKEFENAIKDLAPGDIVGPVETLTGFHVIKLTEVDEPRQMGFDEVKLSLRKNLEEKRRDALYQEWLDELKKQYPVEVFIED